MNLAALRYSPDYRLALAGQTIPAALRGAVTRIQLTSGLDAADRVEITISDPTLRWQEDPALALGTELSLAIGYAPDPPKQLFVGELVTAAPTFPSNGAVTLELAAQDARHRMQQGNKTRWFAVPNASGGAVPIPDLAVAGVLALDHRLIPIFDPVAAGISALLGQVGAAVALGRGGEIQGLIRHQAGQSDFSFLSTIAKENGWEVLVEHGGPLAGRQLRFLSPMSQLEPAATFEYGRSLIGFSPRITKVGQVARISARFWVPQLKTRFMAAVGYDWDRNELTLELAPVTPGLVKDDAPVFELTGTAVDQYNAPRLLMRELLGRLNRRLTASASVVGSPGLKAGDVVEFLAVGRFSGRYRIAEATHSIDSGGYLTSLSLRKEIWFEEPALAMPGVSLN